MQGRTIGQYRVTGMLGQGGMGTVYAAEHTLLGRAAAVKVLLPELSGHQDIVQRFFNEARAAAGIRHPSIVEIYDFGWTPENAAFIVMEYLQGESLRARCARARMPLGSALALTRQIAGALGAAHAKGIVHRDLKPDNVYLVHDPEVPGGERIKLLDFGIAKLADASPMSHRTRTGAVMGTPTYMAPEQCRGVAIDSRADLYSLGCILFELCTGRPPFVGEGEGDVLAAHIHLHPPEVSSLARGTPRSVDALVQRMLAKVPAQRVQTAEEVIRLIDAASTSGAGGGRAPTTGPGVPTGPAHGDASGVVAGLASPVESGRVALPRPSTPHPIGPSGPHPIGPSGPHPIGPSEPKVIIASPTLMTPPPSTTLSSAASMSRGVPAQGGERRRLGVLVGSGLLAALAGSITVAIAVGGDDAPPPPTSTALTTQPATSEADVPSPPPPPAEPPAPPAPATAATLPAPTPQPPAAPPPAAEPAKPEPTKAESPQPEPARPEPPPKPEPARPELAKPEPARSEAARSEAAKSEPAKPAPAKPEPLKTAAPRPEPPTPSIPAKPSTIEISIDSTPSGATVSLGGAVIGKTPYRGTRAREELDLKLVVRLAGHKDETTTVRASSPITKRLKLTPTPPAAPPAPQAPHDRSVNPFKR